MGRAKYDLFAKISQKIFIPQRVGSEKGEKSNLFENFFYIFKVVSKKMFGDFPKHSIFMPKIMFSIKKNFFIEISVKI